MGVYVGGDECRVIYVARNGQQLRVSSVWVGDQQVFPPANRQEIHLFTRDTQGYSRQDHGAYFGFTVPVPWWAVAVDVVIIGAGAKGRDGTKSFTGGTDGAGGRSGAWVVKTIALTQSTEAMAFVSKGTSTSPDNTGIVLVRADGQPDVVVDDGEGTRTANSGATGGTPSPRSRTEFDNYHLGGEGGARNNPGGHPGGGGGGGQGSGLIGNPTSGQNGGDGYVWLRFRSDAPIGGGGFTLYLGTTGGHAGNPVAEWAVSIGKTRQTITEITVPVSVVGPVMWGAFSECTALSTAPQMDTGQVTDFSDAFYRCQSLVSVPAYDTKNVNRMTRTFSGCSSLKSLPPLDMRSAAFVSGMLVGCTSLESANLPGMGNAFTTAQTLDMRPTKLNAAAANALMQSLGTPPPGGNLQLPTTATGANTSIATAKNWTVTFG